MKFFVSSCLAASLLFFSSIHADSLTYTSLKEKVKTETKWDIKEQKDKMHISGSNPLHSIEMECSPSYSLESFSQVDADTNKEFSGKRTNKTLQVTSVDRGRKKTKNYDVGTTPWIQEFKFGFQPFLASNNKDYKFYIIQPKDLGLHGMIATKEGIETLKIDGKTYSAQKVKITLQGFKKKFWKAEVWFDQTNHVLLKYKANEGPGTPVTETTLRSLEGFSAKASSS